jgi:agmatinase
MGTPTFAIPPTFMGVARHDRDADFCVAGIPLDIATTNRSGARGGPQAIRHASRMLVDGHHPASWLDPATVAVSDIGDFAISLGDVEKSLALVEEQAAAVPHLIALGGDHAVTLALLRAARKRHGQLGLVHFDAHVDTWPDSFGLKYGHGSVFFHAIEEGLIDPRRTIQVGIRSPVQREVWDWTLGKGVTVVTAEEVHAAGPQAVAERVRATVGGANTYLSFDIDALDPAFAPGTGTPEVGGLATWQTQGVLRRLGGVRFAGMDVVEVSPPYDVAEITALAAATAVYEYLSLVASPRA